LPTQQEEQQASEFLKRAEIKTMKKDLRALREVDALTERDKIAKIKTLEEQLEDQQKKNAEAQSAKTLEIEKEKRDNVLQRNEREETIAEKDLKNYATEEERQQIFLLESQHLNFEKEIDSIDKEKDPALKLEKNQLLLKRREQETKLNTVAEEERKLEQEQSFLVQKSKTTTIQAEQKSLEQSRWDLDKKIQEVEKKRWAAEKDIQETNSKIAKTDQLLEQQVIDKNLLRDKILGIDKSLRSIYSIVIAREEDKRKGQADEQIATKEALAKMRLEEKEKIQKQQWTGQAPSVQRKPLVPPPIKGKPTKSFQDEEEQRRKFIQDVEQEVNQKK